MWHRGGTRCESGSLGAQYPGSTLLTCVTSGKSLEVFPPSVNDGVGLASLGFARRGKQL